MKQFNRRNSALSMGLALGALLLVFATAAQAQVRITSPTEGERVRGQITVRWEGIPAGGYAMVYMDGKWREAIYENFFSLNTFPPTFSGDGSHTIKVVGISAGKPVGEAQVTFNVANNQIDPDAPAVRLVHWQPTDMVEQGVLRYLIFAESNATIEGGAAGGREGAGGAGGGGAAGGTGGGAGPRGGGSRGGGGTKEVKTVPAPLDFQVSALVRRIIRDVGMLDNSANIQSVVQRAFQRQREDATKQEGAGGAPTKRPKKKKRQPGDPPEPPVPSEPTKAPWGEWEPAQEVGQYFVKTIKQSGEEVNGTRKSPTIAITDLMPRFPNAPVRPGSTWESPMTFITELATRQPLNVQAPITFTRYDTLRTPLGHSRKVAKLEARFRLPEEIAIQIAETLAPKIGAAGGGRGGGEGGGGILNEAADQAAASAVQGILGVRQMAPGFAGRPGAGDTLSTTGPQEAAEVEITVARSTVTRVLWFDIQSNRVLRSEDVVDTYFEQAAAEVEEEEGAEAGDGGMAGGIGGARPGAGRPGGAGMAGAGMGAAGGAAAAPAEPTRVTYNLRVTTWLDDSVPPPTDVYNGGAGTAHARDAAQDPTIDRLRRPTP